MAISRDGGKHRKKAKASHFHSGWERDFLFMLVKDEPVCLNCQQSSALSKKGELVASPRHKPSLARTTRRKAKTRLKAPQQVLTKPVDRDQATTEASCRVSHLLAKHVKAFNGVELFKEARPVTADTLLRL